MIRLRQFEFGHRFALEAVNVIAMLHLARKKMHRPQCSTVPVKLHAKLSKLILFIQECARTSNNYQRQELLIWPNFIVLFFGKNERHWYGNGVANNCNCNWINSHQPQQVDGWKFRQRQTHWNLTNQTDTVFGAQMHQIRYQCATDDRHQFGGQRKFT